MNVIEIREFKKIYKKGIIAVDNLSIKVKMGTFFGFIGPNGAGKTTTVNFMAGLLKQDRGELFLFGERIKYDSYEYKRRIGFVLEKPLYFEKLTGEEYLYFTGKMQDIDKKIIVSRSDELLNFFELSDNKDRLIETYSSGMKKKISLAAALIHDPDILILDEPFEGIDAVSSRVISENLKLMVKRKKTIFLTSHILEIVEKLCDEVAIINKGKLVFQSSIEFIREKVAGERTKKAFSALEELFQTLIIPDKRRKTLSWLE